MERVASTTGHLYMLTSRFAALSGAEWLRRVSRARVAAIFNSRKKSGKMRRYASSWYWDKRWDGGLDIGCETFSPAETAKIKKWALGAKKPRRKK